MKLLASRLVTPRQFALVIGSIFSLGLMSSPALSKTFDVTSTQDSGVGSLRQAVLDANASPGADTIEIKLPVTPDGSVPPIRITSRQIEIAGELTINGSGRDLVTITKSSSDRRLLRVDLGATVTLKGVTIANSENTSGSIIGNFGKLTIQDSAFRNNNPADGGVIVNGSNRDSPTAIVLNLQNVEFTNNTGILNGGAIANFAQAKITGCTFKGNTSDLGGAILNWKSGTLQLDQSTLSENKAQKGGGIYNEGNMVTQRNDFISNIAFAHGGGIFNQGTAIVYLSTFRLNQATGASLSTGMDPVTRRSIQTAKGGGIFNAGTLTLQSNTLEENQASIGGGIFNLTLAELGLQSTVKGSQPTVKMQSTVIRQNTATNRDPQVSGSLIDFGGNQISNN